MTKEKAYTGGLAEVASVSTAKGSGPYRDFVAIEYSFSAKIAAYYIAGNVLVANPGIEALLRYRIPQGINPKILMLDLVLIQRPGIWPQVQTWVPARYVAMGKPGQHTDVDIHGPLGGFALKIVRVP
jgi:hypothetical protein